MEKSLQTDPRIAALRAQLKKKFASAHRDPPPVQECIETGVDWLDREGLGKGTLCEIFASNAGDGNSGGRSGGGIVFHRMLTHAIRKRYHLVLIDGADAFDPSSHPAFSPGPAGEEPMELDGTLLWARCRSVPEAIRVADLIVRDANLPRVVLDLQWCDLREVRRVASSSWFRLRSQVEENGGALMVFTPAPLIPSASLRFEMTDLLALEDCERPESQWAGKLLAKVVRDRAGLRKGKEGEEGGSLSLAS